MTRIRAGKIELGYDIQGASGDWVLMIQGLGYARWGWNWNAPALAERFRVITFDNRGIGESDVPAGPYTVPQMAGDAAALLDALGVPRAHVIGASLGGFIAQELAIARPDLVDRLVLACTGFGGPRYVPMPEVTVRLMAEIPTMTLDERLLRATQNALSPATASEYTEVVKQIVAYRHQTAQPYEPWSWQASASATFDTSDRVGSIEAPTLVITGTEDNVVDYKNSSLLAGELPNATLVEMAGGHLFFIEHAERVNKILTAFLSGESLEGA